MKNGLKFKGQWSEKTPEKSKFRDNGQKVKGPPPQKMTKYSTHQGQKNDQK